MKRRSVVPVRGSAFRYRWEVLSSSVAFSLVIVHDTRVIWIGKRATSRVLCYYESETGSRENIFLFF